MAAMASVTIKGVLVHDGLVLLGRNPRHEWELLGGQPDAADTSVADTLVREFREESGLVVAVGRLVLADLFEVIPGRRVVVVAFSVVVVTSPEPTSVEPGGPEPHHATEHHHAPEHSALRWFPLVELPKALPEIYRPGSRSAPGW
jgi:8-oxo-dGTP pyrophosphatase MutT (NUDIX family)